ncbi:ABC transporter permease [Luteimicrobium xylanilyticum]|uniref:Ribose transport system permease protein RbsC n=1 Tax=Luteimicrobium xylanilyticum TaxID=1133546 RepID=A0A5P9Q6S7_9MICO|nr:ABC transporter permease [Luteimicrobium xylanilyticum]QFU97079.1 Ribose transport system permease protein RbsC [Luteimicrobium xylanilyticum]
MSTLNPTSGPGGPTVPDAGVNVDVTGETRLERITGVAQQQGGLVSLVIVFVAACAFSDGFADWGNFQSILVGNAYTSLLALGMTFVILTGGIDLSVGSMFALGGVLAAWGSGHGGILVAVLLPLVVAALFGLLQGTLIAKARLAPFIVTLAGMLFARGLLQAISAEGTDTYLVPKGSPFLWLGDGTWRPILTAVVLFVLGGILLMRTRFGQALFAIGGSENAALLMGLPVARTKVLVYVLSATVAGAAGMLNASRLQSGVTNIGVGYELTAIAAVIIGGTLLTGGAGSILGTAAGVLLLAVIQNLIGVHLSQYGSSASDLANGLFLAVVVLIQTTLTRVRRLP